MKFATTALSAVALLASTATAQTIVDIAVSTGTHTTLVDLVTQAELVDLLSGDGPWTLFGPTDDAFTALPEAALKFTQPEWHAHLVDILQYHVTAAKVMSTDLTLDQMVGMANGDDATITSLTPPMINTATIDPADVEATNGVVHVINEVLLPTSTTSNIVGILTGPLGSQYTTLVEAVTAAELVDTLSGEGPFTVFAPTNDAFAAVDSGVLNYLLSPEGKDDLVSVLTYHVYSGIVYDVDVTDGDITMVNEDMATVSKDPLMIEDANIVQGQYLASNGVIHPIDKVIIPPSFTMPAPSATESSTESSPDDEDESGAVSMMGSMAALVSAAVALLIV